MSNIAIIPARGGSRRIPRKNIRLFHGKPIIAYSIGLAQQTCLFQRIIVSTDDREIAQIAYSYRAEVDDRSEDLAADDVGTQEVARSVLEKLNHVNQYPEFVCCIYATTPLLKAQDLVMGYQMLRDYSSLLFAMGVGADPLRDAGAFYWSRAAALSYGHRLIGGLTSMIVLPENRVCDINTPEDWARAEKMYEALHVK